MFIFHILVYVAFACVMFSLGKRSAEAYGDSDKIDRYLWWYIAIFTIICALRRDTGIDTVAYVSIFKNGFYLNQLDAVNGEWGFYYLSNFLVKNGLHSAVGLGVCGFVMIFFTVKGLLPHKCLLTYFPIVLFGGSLFLGECNAVRQMMAACIFFYSIKFIVDRKPLYYCLLILAASLFHHSAIGLIVCYFVPYRLDISKNRAILLAIYLACFVFGATPNFQGLMLSLESFTTSIGYDRYTDTVSEILNAGYTKEARAFGPMQMSYFISGLAVIWFGQDIIKRYGGSIPTLSLWYILAVVYGCLYFLVCNVSHLMLRPIMYFQIFQTVMLSLIIYDLFRQGIENMAKMQMARLLVLIIWVNVIWDIIKNYSATYEYVIYKLFFL